MTNLASEIKITRVQNGAAAATSDLNGSSVNMVGFEGVMFVALLGTLSATQVTSLKAQMSSDDGGSDAFADILGTDSGNMADDDDDQVIVLDIYRPVEQYVRPVLLRGTGNAVVDGIVATQYGPGKKPTINDASSVFGTEIHASPAAGTA